jgi:hypothetical protein
MDRRWCRDPDPVTTNSCRMTSLTIWSRSTSKSSYAYADTLQGVVRRMDKVARRWHALQRGGSLTFRWPSHLTFDASKSRRGRRYAKRTPSLARR